LISGFLSGLASSYFLDNDTAEFIGFYLIARCFSFIYNHACNKNWIKKNRFHWIIVFAIT